MKTRAVLYARVSGDDTKKDNLSGQIEMCRKYAQDQGWHIVSELAEDERGVSGASWNAPQLNQALDMAKDKKFDVLVLREMDRFARKLAKQLVLEEQFTRAGVDVVYVLEEYADSPEGRLNKHIRATIAEYEREKIRERMLRGRRREVKKGNVMVHGAGAPYGYICEDKNGITIFIIVESEAGIVRLIFEWYTVEGLTIRAIARRLTEMQVPTPADKQSKNVPKKRGACQWGPSSVDNILNRETYAGTWRYGRYNGFTNTTNPIENHITVDVPAIINRETWEKTRAIKKQNKAQAARNTRHDYLLRALTTCGKCGASVATQTVKLPEKTYKYYRCNAAKKSDNYFRNCDMIQFRADLVDGVVWQWVRDFVGKPDAVEKGARLFQQQQKEAKKPLYDQLKITERLIKEQREQLEKLLDLYLTGGIMQEMLLDRQKRIEAHIEALEAGRQELLEQIESTITDEQILDFVTFAAKIRESLELAEHDFDTQRQLVEMLGIRAKIILVDGQQYVDLTCHFDSGSLLDVSQNNCSRGPRSGFCRRCSRPSSPGPSFVGQTS